MTLTFNADGLLVGDHALTIDQLKGSILVRGPRPDDPLWDSAWRMTLVENLGILVAQLWQVGVTQVFAGGSFAEDRGRPNDIDGYFVCDGGLFREFNSGRLEKRLNALDPQEAWTWGGRSKDGRGESQTRMWHRYRVDLFPLTLPAMPCGIPGPNGSPQSFDQAFRRTRRGGKPRGMIQILESVR